MRRVRGSQPLALSRVRLAVGRFGADSRAIVDAWNVTLVRVGSIRVSYDANGGDSARLAAGTGYTYDVAGITRCLNQFTEPFDKVNEKMGIRRDA
jgi:hypothetical protein